MVDSQYSVSVPKGNLRLVRLVEVVQDGHYGDPGLNSVLLCRMNAGPLV